MKPITSERVERGRCQASKIWCDAALYTAMNISKEPIASVFQGRWRRPILWNIRNNLPGYMARIGAKLREMWLEQQSDAYSGGQWRNLRGLDTEKLRETRDIIREKLLMGAGQRILKLWSTASLFSSRTTQTFFVGKSQNIISRCKFHSL
jgi:hypothetical protein